MTISISGQIPAEAQNGMTKLDEEWMKDRTPDPVFAIVKIERHGVKLVDATQERSATMKFSHIEPATGAVAEQLKAILDQLCNARGGAVATDVELDIPAPEEPEPDFDTPLAEKVAAEVGSEEQPPDDDAAWDAAAPGLAPVEPEIED